MDLREQFCEEYYDKNKDYLPEEQRGIKISPFYWKEYARWLETKLQNAPSNSECQHEYEYVNTTPFIGHKCKKCGHCV